MRERLRTIELSFFWRARNRFFALKRRLGLGIDGAWDPYEIPRAYAPWLAESDPYAEWRVRNDPRPADLARMRTAAFALSPPTRFEIAIAGDGARAATVASLDEQVYDRFELAPAADPSPADFVLHLQAGDALAPHALFAFAVAIARARDVDVVYGDEDTRDAQGRRYAPYFKPGWSPETLLSRDYLGSPVAYRRELIERTGGPRAELGAACLYDLALRATEAARTIVRVPDVLAHRAPPAPHAGASYAADAQRAVRAAVDRRGEPGTVVPLGPVSFAVRYALERPGRVSILLPSRDHSLDVERCLSSLFGSTTYRDFELLFIDNGTREPEALATIERWRTREERMRVLRMDVPFNYSRLNNAAAAQASGDYLLLLNNDTEILTPDWLEALLEQAQRPPIGAVGAHLLYPDGAVQHGGVALGIGGVAGHVHRGSPPGSSGYFEALRTVTNYSAVTGACLMVRKAVFDEAGGLDETLTVAFNDVDFCLRLRRLGYRNVWLPHVVLRHGESKSRGADVGLAKVRRSSGEARTVRARYSAQIDDDPFYNPNLTRADESLALRRPELEAEPAREPAVEADKQRTS